MEEDTTQYVIWIVDGDTFNTSSGDVVRLADIDAPESGEPGHEEATDYLISLIENKTVHVDIDDVDRTDSYGRLVCVVYLEFNSTHYMNVNEALLIQHHAAVWDHPNEFNPHTWTLFTEKAREEGIWGQVGIVITAILTIISLLTIAALTGQQRMI